MNRYLHLIFVIIIVCGAPRALQASDPDTLRLQPGPLNGTDADIRDDRPNTPNGTSYDFIANAWTAQGNFFIERSLIRFDLTPIPSGATVLSAILKLSTNQNTSHYQMDSGPNPSYFLRVLNNWDENQVTWNNQPATTMNDAVIVPQSTSNTQTYYLDLTGHVQEMVTHPESNFGWLFRQQTEERYRCLVFASSDNPEASWRPMLTVIYTMCPLPVADFYTSIHQLEVTFHDTSKNTTSWAWNFGDGSVSNLQNPVHTYLNPGIYEVCLTATDSCGSSVKCQMVDVACPLPEVSFSYMVDYPVVSFTDESSAPSILSWLWDFGDGATSNLQNPQHSYSGPGYYNVCLTVADSCGSSVTCKIVDLTCPGPAVQYEYYFVYQNVQFVDTASSYPILSRYWDFGDSTFSTAHNPLHTYLSGLYVYYVCFSATDSCGTGSVCDSIYVMPPMKPHFTSETNMTNDLEVNFTGKSEGAAIWDWSFGDGNHSNLRNPSHLYADYGNYQVCVTVTNPLGSDSSCDSLLVIEKMHNTLDAGIVYPNPTSGIVKIKFDYGKTFVHTTLSNSLGSTVMESETSSLEAGEPIKINLGDLPKGVYFLRIDTDQISRVEKIIRQ